MTIEQTDFTTQLISNRRQSFETIVEEMCERLQDTQREERLRQIRKLEEILDSLAQELDLFLSGKKNPAITAEITRK